MSGPAASLSSPGGSGGGGQSVAALLSSMKKEQTYDYLRASAIPDLVKCLAAQAKKDSAATVECIQFSDEVVKINRKQKKQSRVLLLTNRAVYNFEKGSYKSPKRRISIKDLCGCILSRCSDELVLQVEDSYDYRYEIKRRSDFLEMLSRAYDREMANAPAIADRQLMVTFSEEAELKDMVITKDSLKNSQRVSAASLGPQQPAQAAATEEEHSQSSLSSKDGSGSTNGVDRMQSNSVSMNCAPPSQTGGGGGGEDVPAAGTAGKHHSSGSLGACPSPSNAASSSAAAADQDPASPAAAPSPHSRRMSATDNNGNGTLRSPKAAKPRLSFVTHGTALITPQQLAKGGSSQQPGSHLTSGQFVPTSTAAAAAGGSLAPPTNYRAHKHNSVIVTRTSANGSYPNLLGGAGAGASASSASSAAASSAGAASPAQPAPRITSVETSDSGHAFRDPSSRLEGWLTKKKGSGKKWDRKYFVLTNSQLQYYAPRIKGNLPMKTPVLVERSASEEIALGTVDNQKSTTPLVMLRVLTAVGAGGKHKDSLTLAFATESDAQRWTDAFNHRNLPISEVGGADQYVHCEGWVLKKESDSKWVRRYVVLTGDRVWFMELGLKGSIDFDQGVSAHNNNEIKPTEEVQSSTFAGRAALTRFAYRWVVSDSVRIFHLAADSEEDMTHWIESIDCINREHGKAGGSLAAAAAGEEAAAAAALLSADPASALVLPDEFISAVEQPAPEGQVTFVFTDVQSSTNLWEKVPDAMDRALEQHDRLLRELLKKYAGYEVKTEGDAFMVTFFTALDAILWCLDVQCTLLEAQWSDDFCSMKAACHETVIDPATGAPVTVFNGIRIRMGIHTGYPNCRRNPVTGRMDYFGPVVNRSARVSDTGHGGQIVCTQEVVDSLRSSAGLADARLSDARLKPLVSDMGCHALKGIVEDVRIYQLMPAKLALRTLPPIRTSTNEKAEKERAAAKLSAGAATGAGANVPSRSPTPSPPPSAAAAVAASSSPAAAASSDDAEAAAARARAESTVPMMLAILVTPPNAEEESPPPPPAPDAAAAAPAGAAGARVSVAPEIPPPPDLTGFED